MGKKTGLVGALLMVAACAPTATKRSTGSLDTVLRTAVEQRRVPGVVAMVATTDAVAYQGAFGLSKDGIFAIASMTKPVTSVAVMQLVEAGKVKLLFDPGTRWEYGISTDWLGKLVEKVSGQTLEAYFRQGVFEPLGMEDTFFNVPPDKQPRLVPLHQRKEDGTLAEQARPPAKPVKFLSGGGGLHSTAADYLKFTRAMMADGRLGQRRILTPESVALMGRNQIGELGLRPVTSFMPQLVKDGAKMPGLPDKFGLGFALNTQPLEKGRGANTISWAGIYNTFFWIDRDKKVCSVLMTQMLPFLDDGPQALVDDFDRAVYAWRDASAQ
jgi:CubicO group peptidase (beta-lactamase class C family)